jgi:hypothetical protein
MPGPTYEQSSEAGRERMLPVPYTRLVDQTPTVHDPAAVTSAVPGTQITGVSVSLDTRRNVAVLNVARGTITRQFVRNCITYAGGGGGAENGWRVINIGDPVYYDGSTTMLALNLQLSTAPADNTLVPLANPLFGWVVMLQDETAANFPKGAGGAGSTQTCAVMHV